MARMKNVCMATFYLQVLRNLRPSLSKGLCLQMGAGSVCMTANSKSAQNPFGRNSNTAFPETRTVHPVRHYKPRTLKNRTFGLSDLRTCGPQDVRTFGL